MGNYEKAKHLADLAVEKMTDLAVTPMPQNFEIWYQFYSGNCPDLTNAVNVVLSSDRGIDDDMCTEIYQQFFTNEAEAKSLRLTGDKLENQLNEVLSFLDSHGTDTSDYGTALNNFSGELEDPDGSSNVDGLIADMVQKTQAMMETTQRLEQELNSSTEQIGELKTSLERTRREANTDQLTGVGNRKYFDSRLRQAVADAMETGEELCLALCDIDHFKKFNDTYGHQMGDQVLRLVAGLMTKSVKGQDIVARYGGEEFALVLPRTELANAVVVANNVRDAIQTKRLVKRSTGEDISRVTISIGVARFEPGEPIHNLIQRADEALYAAKDAGRNQVLTQDDTQPAIAARA